MGLMGVSPSIFAQNISYQCEEALGRCILGHKPPNIHALLGFLEQGGCRADIQSLLAVHATPDQRTEHATEEDIRN